MQGPGFEACIMKTGESFGNDDSVSRGSGRIVAGWLSTLNWNSGVGFVCVTAMQRPLCDRRSIAEIMGPSMVALLAI